MGLEEEIETIDKSNIDKALKITKNYLDSCLFIKYYIEDETFGETILGADHVFNENEINQWFEDKVKSKYFDYLKTNLHKSGHDRIGKLEVRYQYFRKSQTYIRDSKLYHWALKE